MGITKKQFDRIATELIAKNVIYCLGIKSDGDILGEAGDRRGLFQPDMPIHYQQTPADRASAFAARKDAEIQPQITGMGKTNCIHVYIDDDTLMDLYLDHEGDPEVLWRRARELQTIILQLVKQRS